MPKQTDLKSLPKVEIHVHLEGSFEPATIEKLAREAGEPLPPDRDQLLQFSGLADFLSFLDWCCSLVQTEEQLSEAAYGFCRRMAADGTGYADIIVNPTHWRHWHWRIGEMLDALDRGFSAAERDGLPSAGLCASHSAWGVPDLEYGARPPPWRNIRSIVSAARACPSR